MQTKEKTLAKAESNKASCKFTKGYVTNQLRTNAVKEMIARCVAEVKNLDRGLLKDIATSVKAEDVIKKAREAAVQNPPKTAFYAGQAHAYMNRDLMLQWLQLVVLPHREEVVRRKGLQGRQPIVLLLDRFSAHLCREVLDFCREHDIRLVLIPAGLTDLLQPAEFAANKDFKGHLTNIRRAGQRSGNEFAVKTHKTAHSVLLRAEHAAMSQVSATGIRRAFERLVSRTAKELFDRTSGDSN